LDDYTTSIEQLQIDSHWLLPQWYSPIHRVAYNAWRLRKPDITPDYFQPEDWVMQTWWAARGDSAEQR
jgi:microcin C transport system substrate-binding protein